MASAQDGRIEGAGCDDPPHVGELGESMTNPWSLPPREVEVMNLLIQTGLEKIVALELGLSRKTVQELVGRTRKRMGARTRLLAAIEWDRWSRKEAA
jgi:DNA-binding NarL/FixJ family response regulator